MKRLLFFSGLLFFVLFSGTAHGGKESLPAIYILLFDGSSSDIIPLLLNDTGITRGGNYPSGNNAGCSGVAIGAQDCSGGRDITHNNNTDGHAGFSFTKISSTGQELSANAPTWSCVKDNVTGLMWEVKTTSGLHNRASNFTWYNTDPATNGGANGDPGGNNNTQTFVTDVNTQGLCGASDWRMPSYGELQGIVSYGHYGPTIDIIYFPNSQSGFFWSGTSFAGGTDRAMGILFLCGNSWAAPRTETKKVRLVRSN